MISAVQRIAFALKHRSRALASSLTRRDPTIVVASDIELLDEAISALHRYEEIRTALRGLVTADQLATLHTVLEQTEGSPDALVDAVRPFYAAWALILDPWLAEDTATPVAAVPDGTEASVPVDPKQTHEHCPHPTGMIRRGPAGMERETVCCRCGLEVWAGPRDFAFPTSSSHGPYAPRQLSA